MTPEQLRDLLLTALQEGSISSSDAWATEGVAQDWTTPGPDGGTPEPDFTRMMKSSPRCPPILVWMMYPVQKWPHGWPGSRR